VLSDVYQVKLVALRLTSVTPRTAVLSTELRRRDGEPIPGDITFDTAVTDNRFVEYNVPCTYTGFGARGEEVSIWEGPSSIVQDLTIGPLHERVRWLGITVTIYTRKPTSGEALAFDLTALEVLDLGNHPVESALSTEPVRWASLVGRRVPIYPGARRVEIYDRSNARRWGNLSYTVPGLPYPSRDVAAFYSEWAPDNDWLPVEPSTRSWQQFIDATQGSEVTVCQLWREWREKKSGDRLVVTCEYRLGKEIVRGEGPTDSARDQIVYVGIYPAESAGAEQAGRDSRRGGGTRRGDSDRPTVRCADSHSCP
jgi:hypothetical protein